MHQLKSTLANHRSFNACASSEGTDKVSHTTEGQSVMPSKSIMKAYSKATSR